ncbi:DUF6194 family protein [Schumannella sp. 10F1B-5-1]|uniref:DUF6194 family protein n=1 Tax=Schumannella sp. 10F1B-5-1 TaxID=2590780 RepID=UPI001131AAC6|nr:DUF6194 family protein [Schumannella sp. 10F1B-5-1]TPW70709.1 erythromycin esterase [Schumannella sp. 10F1B-5-1]
MTETELLVHLSALEDAVVQTAAPGDGSPEIAWGDSFVTVGVGLPPEERGQPFATIVTKDYPGFDAASQLDRPGAFRVNVQLGREAFTARFGYPPREAAAHREAIDFAEPDRLLPHPTYAEQGWAAVVLPGPRTQDDLLELIGRAHVAALERRDRRR